VIFLKVKNEKYKTQLVQKYERNEEALTITFIKGYKSPKWP
jgi:transposase-like protein